MTTTSTQRTTSLRSVIESFAGYQTPPVAGTTALLFGACDAGACERCPERTTVGATVLVCSCPHHGEQAADFDARWGEPWWIEAEEGE